MSTFSTDLKIELIGTGEQSGVWGTTTNNNFQNVFEQALVGRVSVPFTDANVTLSATDTVNSQSFRRLYLNCTGANTASRDLIVPTINKTYVVQNNTTGSQDIVIKTSAGTGVTVPNGKTVAVYVDGTNVIQSFDYVPTLGVGTANVTTLNVTTIDTTNLEVTNIKAKDGTASASIADSTGIFTHSTATVFPAGTVSAPSITTTGDTNTGIFFPAADTIAFTEGGAEAMRIDSSGNVGIGTTTPATILNAYNATSAIISLDGDASSNLRVSRYSTDALSGALTLRKSRGTFASQTAVSSGDASGLLNFNLYGGTSYRTTAQIASYCGTYTADDNISGILLFATRPTGASAGLLERMRIDDSGNVGIGTSSPTEKLTVSGNASLSGNLNFTGTGNRITGDFTNATFSNRVALQTSTTNGNTGIPILPNGSATISSALFFNNSDPTNASALQVTAVTAETSVRSIITGTGTYMPMTFYTGGSERIRIDTSGNVGIGTTTPATILNAYNATSAIISVDGDATTIFRATRYSTDFSNATLQLRKARGTLASPTAVANGDVVGTMPIQAYGGTNFRNIASIAGVVDTYTSDTNISGFLTFSTNGGSTAVTERMRITAAGNVGIGTSSPVAKLQSAGAAATTTPTGGSATGSGLYINNTDTAFGMMFGIGGGGDGWIQQQRSDSTNTQYNLLLQPIGGNVGIGTSSPQSLLDVGAGSTSAPTYKGIVRIKAPSSQSLSADGGIEFVATTFASGYGYRIGAFDLTGGNVPLVFQSRQNSATWTEVMRIDSSGRLLVGTTATTTSSTQSGEVYSTGAVGFLFTNTTAGNYPLSVKNEGTSGTKNLINFYEGAAGGTSRANISFDSSNNFAFASTNATTFSTASAERMRITSGGEVYIAGTTDQGAYNLQCNGTGVWGAGAYVNGSDARIKEDVAPIDSGLDVVEKLNPVTYRYKEDWSKDQSTQTGFIAQELLTALDGKNYVDGIVQQGGSEGYYSVAYQNIIPILTKAIQELSAKNAALEARISALES